MHLSEHLAGKLRILLLRLFNTKKMVMKKYLLIALGALSVGMLSLQSCTKLEDAVAKGKNGDVSMDDTLTINIPPITSTSTQYATGTFEMDIDSFISANNTSGLTIDLSKVDTFKVTSCSLTIQNPTTADNFQDFELSGLYFNTNVNSTQATIGEIANNPDTYSSYLILPTDPTLNLKTYLNDGKVTFNYFLGVKARRNTATTLHVYVHVTYDFHWHF
jgi:hypothetical protein